MAPRPNEGAYYRLSDALGVGPGALFVGQVVCVRHVVPARERGAHDDSEDAVVVQWDEPSLVIGDDGTPTHGMVRRALSVGLSRFGEMFEEV